MTLHKYLRGLILKFILAGGMLSLLFHFVPLAEVGAALRGVAPGYLVLGVLLQFLARAVMTLRMHVITANQGMAIGHVALFRILLATQFYSLFLPGSLTGGGVTWLKYVQAGVDKSGAVAAVMLNRGIGTLIMIVIGVLAWLLDRGATQPGAVAGALLLSLALLFVVFGRFPITDTAESASGKSPWFGWFRVLVHRLLRFQRVSPAGKSIVLAGSLVYEFIGAVSMWCFALAVGVSLDLLTVIWVRAALQMVLMVPLSFAGIGVREASLVGLGSLIGVAPALAVAWSLAFFTGNVTVAAVGGLLETNTAGRYLASERDTTPARTRRETRP